MTTADTPDSELVSSKLITKGDRNRGSDQSFPTEIASALVTR